MDRQIRMISDNKRATFEYHILERCEAGIELKGTEVKSLRVAKASLQDAFCRVENGELFLYNLHIAPYEMGNRFNHDAKRTRRLLLHKKEIARLFAKAREKGLTIVPLRMYFSGSLAKVEIALCQGKRLHDKRDAIAEKDARRELERAVKERNRAI